MDAHNLTVHRIQGVEFFGPECISICNTHVPLEDLLSENFRQKLLGKLARIIGTKAPISNGAITASRVF